MGEVAASRLLWVLIMYVYRDVTSRALQCINVTSTVTRDSTACCLRLTSDRSQTAGKKNGTSIGQRWDVFAGLRACPLYIGHVYAHHHKWYITRDLSAVLVLRDACLRIIWDLPRHWIISWQFSTFCEICFLFRFAFFSVWCNDFGSICSKPRRLPQEMWRWRRILNKAKL